VSRSSFFVFFVFFVHQSAFTDPPTREELAQADADLKKDAARQKQEHFALQRRRRGAVRSRIVATS
jgi:hypothetical protein